MKLVAFIFLCFIFSISTHAYVQVNPTRILLENGKKVGHFTVRNSQPKSVKVVVSLKYFSMDKTGKMSQTKTLNEKINLKKILFSPRNFELEAGKKQVVRFFIRDKISVDTKELYGYAHFETEIIENNKSDKRQMKLIPKVAVAIPVVYRTQTVKSNLVVENVKKIINKNGSCKISLNLKNNDHSSYFDVKGISKSSEETFIVKGISNYLDTYKWEYTKEENCKNSFKIVVKDVDSKNEQILNL